MVDIVYRRSDVKRFMLTCYMTLLGPRALRRTRRPNVYWQPAEDRLFTIFAIFLNCHAVNRFSEIHQQWCYTTAYSICPRLKGGCDPTLSPLGNVLESHRAVARLSALAHAISAIFTLFAPNFIAAVLRNPTFDSKNC